MWAWLKPGGEFYILLLVVFCAIGLTKFTEQDSIQ